jgi:Sulfotransferase domain
MAEFQNLPESDITAILNRAFRITDNDFIDDGTGCILPQQYRKLAEKVKKFKVRSNDVFLCSVPRTGSTWLSEILWLLGNDLDFEKARNIVQQVRTPTLELSALLSDDKDLVEWLK